MSNEYNMDEEYYSCARAFARHIHDHSPDFEEWFVKNFPTVLANPKCFKFNSSLNGFNIKIVFVSTSVEYHNKNCFPPI